MNENYIILPALREDGAQLCDFFLAYIDSHREYISHGEIQMGVGQGQIVDGEFVTSTAPEARKYWLKYYNGHFDNPSLGAVFKVVHKDEPEKISGFCVVEITDDGAEPFGMLCDVLVSEQLRGQGIGSALISTAIEWFHEHGIQDIYLESGMHNHSAHSIFVHKGFKKVSEIYKLM